MAYTFKTSQIAAPFVDELNKNLPITTNASNQLNKDFVGGNGTTMTIIIPDYGEVGVGPSLQESEMGYTAANRTVTLEHFHKGIAADAVQRALNIFSFEDQVSDPYAQQFASFIERKVSKVVQLQADHQFVYDTSDPKYFAQTAKLISRVKASRCFGEVVGCLSEQASAEVGASGIGYFNPASELSKIYKDGKGLGIYQGVMHYASPDVDSLTTGTLTLPANAKVKTAILAEGATTLVITSTSGLSGTVKAGQGFQIPSVKAVDIYGNSIGSPYTFVALADSTAETNDISITVKPVYFTGPGKNVSVSSIAANLAVTQLQEADSFYVAGIHWSKTSLVVASARFGEISGTDRTIMAPSKGVLTQVLRGPDAINLREIVRWDTLVGETLVRTNHAAASWLKVGE